VLGFDVAVDVAGAMGDVKDRGDSADDGCDFGEAEARGSVQDAGEALALHQGHDDEGGTVFQGAFIEDFDDAGVRDAAGDFGFASESGAEVDVIDVAGAQGFDG
jgi:hypothetical protein